MDREAETKPKADLRDYLAAERTLLAWIRTGLALMGFGFVVARFGLFLQELQVAQRVPLLQPYGLSLWFGVALIVMGVAVNLFSAWRHSRLIRELNLGEEPHSRPSAQAIVVAVILALVGLAMAAYLVSIRNSTSSASSSTRISSWSSSRNRSSPLTTRSLLRLPLLSLRPNREHAPAATDSAAAPPAAWFASDQFLADLAEEIDDLGLDALTPSHSEAAPLAAPPRPEEKPAGPAEHSPLKEVFDDFPRRARRNGCRRRRP